MIYEITMPSLGADMDQGKFIEWMTSPGAHVKKGDSIAVIETQKAAVEIESFHNGAIKELLAKKGDVIEVGKVIATMELDAGEHVPEQRVPRPSRIETPTEQQKRVFASPAAKKLALEKRIDLSAVTGSGLAGAIELKDVEEYISKTKPEAGIKNIREAIARAMARSKKEIPHYYLKSRIDITHLVEWLTKLNSTKSPAERILMPSVLVAAVASAVKKHPDMNGYFQNNKFESSQKINIGMALSVKSGGVIVPALLDIQDHNLEEIDRALKDLIERSREEKLRNTELTMGTITVTNLGDLGADEVFGVIFPPQVALIGFGRSRKEISVEDDKMRTMTVLDVSLSADHRVSDGLSGSRFLKTIEKYLANPEGLVRARP